ncbi:uncharacterized protein BP5553_07540 [Venustampulla echinocandica]|uniref:Jacalin-type lectin domain-containing protein n=1 Tax=Venustampulla echinocandica TaxID=2656787 RepID=A0A370TGU2_9HELO|nr:uncharacterized protein BP5553_07540 [Venustampulla echinocandica]RDL34412.1 hypothetical protein BP5553_07540 [Venustampulla echinocandica]
MRFSNQTLLTGATTLLSLASLGRADGCEKGPFGDSHKFGKTGGGYYCDTAWDKGLVITGLEVWANEWHVKGIQWAYSDGTKSVVRGMNVGDRNQAITWGAGDKITRLQMWGNYAGDAVGKIEIETSSGKKLSQGSDVGTFGGEPVLTHSGILLGGRGSSNDFVNELEMLFLASNVQKGGAVITAVKFQDNLDDWNKKMKGIETTSLDAAYFINSNKKGSKQSYQFSKSLSRSVGKTLTQQYSTTLGASVSVTVGAEVEVPLFKASESVTASASYSYEAMDSTSTDTTTTGSLTWTLGGDLEPNHCVECTGSAIGGTYESDYESTVTITLATGQKFKITQPGHFNSTNWAKSSTECKDIPIKDCPKTATEIGGGTKRGVVFIS